VSISVLRESLLLGVHPVLVESALNIVVKLGSPNSLEGTETTWGLDVTDKTNNLHWWAFKNSASVHNILFDDLFTFTALLILNDVGHASLVSNKSSEVDWLRGIISWERSYTTTVVSCAALGNETKVTVSRLFVLAVGHSAFFYK